MTTSTSAQTVTILFTDVEGSTELRARRGDRPAQEILRAQERLLRERIEGAGGRVVKALGDGVMASFASARSAVRSAVDIQRALSDEGVLRIRIGLNAGEVTEEDGDLFGQAVHAAARIMGRAKGGQILVPAVVRDLAGAEAGVFRDRGLFWLKGFPERWRLYEVEWREDAPRETEAAVDDRRPFVGREGELADLRRALESAADGHGSLVLIGGEPGVGKTRLAQEIAGEADAMRMRSLIGHCSEMEGAPPYMPWVEVLEQALGRAESPEAFRELLGESAGEVARIVPELRRRFPDIPAPLELPPEQERRYLFNSIRDFLFRAAELRPILLILDDLHWADEPSLRLLEHVAEAIADVPVLVVGTYRDVELEVGRPLARSIEELRRRRLVQRVSLKRLSEEAVGQMLAGLSGQPPPPALVKVIFSESDGNAFFVEEVYYHLMEEGRLLDERGRWRTDLDVDEVDVPESVRLVIGRRLERVGEDTRKVLASAAILGKFFDAGALETVAACGEDAVLDALDEAERAKLVLPAEGMDRFGFAHELIRQTLLAGVSTLRRQRLHLRAADVLEARAGQELQDVAADLAYHLTQAGAGAPVERTGRALVLAGRRALAGAAFEQALGYLESASSLSGAFDERGTAELMDALGTAYAATGRWDEAVDAWNRALDGYERLPDPEAVGRVAYPMTVQLVWAARYEDAMVAVGRGLNALDDRVNADRVRLTMNGALMFGAGGYASAAEEMFEDAARMAEQLHDEGLSAEILAFHAITRWQYMRFDEAVELARRSTPVLARSGAMWEHAQVHGFEALSLLFGGRFGEARGVAEEGVRLARKVGHHGAEVAAGRPLIALDIAATGGGPGVRDALENDLRLCAAGGLPWIAEAYTWRGLQAFHEGRWDQALPDLEEGLRRENFGAFAGWERGPLMRHLVYLGQGERAMELWDDRAWEVPAPGDPVGIGIAGMLVFGLEALALLGRLDIAGSLYDVLAGMPQSRARVYDCVPMERSLAVAAACAGRWEDAERHFDEGARLAREWPVVIEQADGPRWRAWALMLRDAPGDRDRARTLLEEARAGFEALSMPKHVELVERMLASAREAT